MPRLLLVLPLSLTLLPPAPCRAAAAWLTETGGADMAMAGAGRSALALDAAALAANPAALAGLGGTVVTVAYLPVRTDFRFRGDDGPSGSTDHQAITPAGSIFVAHDTGRLALGVGAYSHVGAGFDYGHHWAGRYAAEDAQLKSLDLAGALAYRITDRLDVGVTLGAQYVDVDAGLAINNSAMFYGPPVDLADGQLRMQGGSWQPAGSVGFRYRLGDDTRIGLSWTAATRQSVALDVRARGLHPVLSMLLPASSDADLRFTVPQQVSVGVSRQVTPDTLAGVGAAWQDWSAFGRSTLEILDQRIAMFPDGLKDTWNASAGIRHRLSPDWTWSAGVAYDSSPETSPAMPAYMPVAQQWRVAVGAEHRLADGAVVRAALSVIDQADVRIAQPSAPWPLPGAGAFSGTVQGNRAYVLCIASDFTM